MSLNSIKNWFKDNRQPKRTPRPTARLALETLELRDVPAAITASLSNHILTIDGTSGPDSIAVYLKNNAISVNSGNIKIKDGAVLKPSIPLGSVNSIRINGYAGADTLSLNTSAGIIPLPGILDGGADDDWLIGGSGMDTLIGGAGKDKFSGNSGFDTYRDDFDLSKPVLNGVAIDDIVQAGSYTCQTLSALAEGVRQGINFGNYITRVGNTNQFDVKLPGARTQRITFDGSWTDGDPQPRKDADGKVTLEFWTILMQRARLQYLGVPYNQEWTDAFIAVQKVLHPELTSVGSALVHFTGKNAGSIDVSAATTAAKKTALAQDLQTRLGKGDLLVACSYEGDKKKHLNADGIAYSHCYAVLDVRKLANGKYVVDLYNPWADDCGGANSTTLDSNKPASRTVKDDGFITLDLDAFQRSYKSIGTGKK